MCLLAFSLTAVANRRPADVEARIARAYAESLCYRESGDLAAQAELLQWILRLDSTEVDALHDLALVWQQLFLDSAALACHERALRCMGDEISERRQDYSLDYAYALMEWGRFMDAATLWRSLTGVPRLRNEAYEMLAQCYERSGEAGQMLAALDEWGRIGGEDAQVMLLKVRSLERLGRQTEAIAEARRLWELYPTEIYYGTVVGEMLLEAGDTTAAWEELERLRRMEPQNPSVQLLGVHYAQKVRNRTSLYDGIEQMILNPDIEEPMRQNLLQTLMQTTEGTPDEERIGRLFEKLMEQELSSTALPQMYATWLAERNAPVGAYGSAMRRWILTDPDADELVYHLWFQEAIEQSDYAELERRCREALSHRPDRLSFYSIAAMGLHELGDNDAGVALLEEGLRNVEKESDTDEVSILYSSLGDLLQYCKRQGESQAAYDSALVYNPLNVVALNNYAYFLAVENVRLGDALQMAELVMKIEPDNGTYVDTYAWILYRLGDLEGAKKEIDRTILLLLEGDEQSGTVYEHASAIYRDLGMDKAADAYMEMARERGE